MSVNTTIYYLTPASPIRKYYSSDYYVSGRFYVESLNTKYEVRSQQIRSVPLPHFLALMCFVVFTDWRRRSQVVNEGVLAVFSTNWDTRRNIINCVFYNYVSNNWDVSLFSACTLEGVFAR